MILALLLPVAGFSQSTRVKGRVTDTSGEGIPFVAVFFSGTTTGVSTDMDGYYTLETRDTTMTLLRAEILGYDPKEQKIKPRSFQEVNFSLELSTNNIAAAVVKPDNRYLKWILSQIDEKRKDNDPERKEAWQCDVYNKMEIDLTNASENLNLRLIKKNFGFVFDYMDTSVVSGKAFLPIMISETVAKRYHRNAPTLDKEVIEASRISGINDENFLSQFTGSLHLKTNFYRNFINAFNVEIPSPLSTNGELYYNYYLIDSLHIDGRKTWKIRFHPKKLVSSPVWDGEMSIDSADFALREIHVRLTKDSNVNWIKDLVVDQEHKMVNDSTWFWGDDRMYVDFSPIMNDSTKIMTIIGNRTMHYSNPDFSKALRKDIADAGDNVMVKKDAGGKDEDYWQSARPYSLSTREQNIYNMVDSIKNVPIYRDMYSLIATFVNGYYDIGKFGYGPVANAISFNTIEGVRLYYGMRTSNEFSRKLRIGGYVAYGFKDKAFKGGTKFEYMFSTQPWRKLTVNLKRDLVQLGRSSNAFSESNIMSSMLAKGGGQRRSPVTELSIAYDHEWSPGFNNTIGIDARRVFSNRYVPMIRPDGELVQSVAATILRYRARFSWDETVTRGTFEKSYVHTKYPYLTFDIMASPKGIAHNDFSFLRAEATLDWRLALPPAGYSLIRLNAGKIQGRVPYPFLKLHEGNGTYFLDKGAFACMEFYEFASDSWATLFVEHNFGGFFLGKVPLLRKLNLREVATFKAAYGTLSDRNNGIVGTEASKDAALLFPKGMSSLEKPYVEMGVGISNILRLFRVDAFWRMTHRYKEVEGVREKSPNCFVVNLGMEFKF